VRQLFMPPQQQEGAGGDSAADGTSSSGSGPFSLLCKQEQAHPLDVNCVRWHPADPSLLASAGDDCCIKLWRWRPQVAVA
jgi:WD40 repeat protein